MNRYVKKILFLFSTIFLVSVFTFIAFQIIPSDSARAILGKDATEEAVKALREQLGMNDPMVIQYIRWAKNALQGDFGISTSYNIPVKELISHRLPITVYLAFSSMILIVIVSIPLGIFMARKKEGMRQSIFLGWIHTTMAIPPFFLGILITLVFGLIFGWFSPGRYVAPSESISQFIKYMLFPTLSISLPQIAMLVKFLRSSLLKELDLDYVRTANSKGNTSSRILYKHVLRNGLIPVITFIGMAFAETLAGSIIVEQVFSVPGIGRLLVASISNRDYMVVQGIILYIVISVVVINFIVDMVYEKIDPRIRM